MPASSGGMGFGAYPNGPGKFSKPKKGTKTTSAVKRKPKK